jgi:hypothetical protein
VMISLQFDAFAKAFFQSVLPCDSPYSFSSHFAFVSCA